MEVMGLLRNIMLKDLCVMLRLHKFMKELQKYRE